MKHHVRLLSAMLSCAVAAVSFTGTLSSVNAAENDSVSAEINDTIISEESKEAAVSADVQAADAPFNVFDIYNAHVAASAPATEPEIPIYRTSKGIDVSQWQADVDWKKVKESGAEFAIVRAGYGKYSSQKDLRFDEHMKNAQAAGLNCGAYWYSYAVNVEEARQEAEACYEIIKNYKFTYPIYFDIEDPSQKYLSTAQISAIVETFCSTLQAKGYYVGIYSYASFLNSKIFDSVLDKYDVWVAHFDVAAPDFAREYGMWQYKGDSGTWPGVSGNVDLDYSYKNYPYIIDPENYVDPSTPPAEVPGVPKPVKVTIPDGVKATGFDVSVWQGDIDWKKVAAENDTDYAIIRAGYGNLASQKDKYFDANMKGAKEAGLDVGVYWYSYASSPADALLEAKACYEVIKNYKLEYPVYFDIEDASIAGKSVKELTEIVETFCSFFESKGYYVGITSYTNFLNTKLDPSLFNKYDVWVAHYGVSRPGYTRNYGMWQYSSTGSVEGIFGNVDLDYSYLNFPKIMSDCHLNGF